MTNCIQSCEEWEQLVRFAGLEFISEILEECSFPIYFTSWCHPRFYCLLRTVHSEASVARWEHFTGGTPVHNCLASSFINTALAAVHITLDSCWVYKSNKVKKCSILSEIDTEHFRKSASKGSFWICLLTSNVQLKRYSSRRKKKTLNQTKFKTKFNNNNYMTNTSSN